MGECLILQSARLKALNRPHGADGAADKLALLERQTAANILPAPGKEPQDQYIHRGEADTDGGKRQIVNRHRSGEEYNRGEVESIGCEATREQPSDLLVAGNAVCDITRVALTEELHRQRQDPPDKAAAHDHGKLGLDAQEQRW